MNDVRPFEEYKEMIQDMSKEEMIKGLYDLSKNVIEKDKEIERLKEELEVSRTNEETYRLEMKDITKRLDLDEDTLFDEVKDKAERLNNIINELDIEANKNIQVCNNRGFNLISNIDEVKNLDDFTFNEYIGYLVSLEILDKLQELKGDSDKE